MDLQRTIRQPPLTSQVVNIISARIASRAYPPDSQLPPEMDLAAELCVSRATIRRALDLLVERGLIYRRHGIGTFVKQPPDIRDPLNQFIDFREMLRLQGYRPGLIELSTRVVEAEPIVCEVLDLAPKQRVLEVHKYFTADDELVVYCVNHIPLWVFEGSVDLAEVTQPGILEPILDFYEIRCGKKIDYYSCAVRAEIIKFCGLPFLSENFKPQTPVLIVDEIGYGQDERPLHHSIEYHPGNHMQFGLVRILESSWVNPRADVTWKALQKLNQRISSQKGGVVATRPGT